MMARQKNMFELYQYVAAGVLSAVVSSSDVTVNTERKGQENMCVDISLEQKVGQCRVENNDLNDTAAIKKKKQYAALQQVLSKESMIVSQKVLEAVIQVESGGNLEVGSKGNGCGVMQLTLSAVAGGLARLYSPTSRHDRFREKYAGAVDMKKKMIDGVTDTYFTMLEFGAQRATERIGEIKTDYNQLADQKKLFKADAEIEREVKLRLKILQEEREVLGQFAAAVKHGYLLFDSGARQVYDTKMASLRKVKDADRYITDATGIKLGWVSYAGKQRQMIEDMRRKACDVAHMELYVAFGDLLLATEGDYFMRGKKKQVHTPLQRTLFAYNQGRNDYLTKGAGKEKYYRRFASAYRTLFDEKAPTSVPLRESRLIM